MPAVAPYIPVRNTDLLNWALNFSTLITAAPATYGLVAGDATAIAAQYTALNAAFGLISSPSTKTAATVAAFVTAKVNALAVFRPYAQQIANNAGVSPTNKTALGLNPRTSVPSAIPAPVTNPVLTIQSTSTAGSVLRYRDALASPSVKAKPFGAIAMQLFAMASLSPVTDASLLPLVTTLTKNPALIPMGPADAGKTVYWAARWVTRKGLVGPFSPIINYVVAG